MEQWQIDAVIRLFENEETAPKEIEEGQRVYTSSTAKGTDIYHMIDKLYNGVQIEQADINDKWNKRVSLYDKEVKILLVTLLRWHFADVQAELLKSVGDDALGDLDDHPF